MKSKIAVITGGSRGLGRSMALHLSQKGADVIITYNSKKEEAMEVVNLIEKNGQKAYALKLDVGDIKSFDTFTKELKDVLKSKWQKDQFNYLVNNAGIGLDATILETTEEQFDLLTNIHFKGPFFLTQKLFPLISDNGKIINISSGLARFSYPGKAVYGALKGAIEVLTRYMAKEFGGRGIIVNTIAPGPIATDFGGGLVRDNETYNKALSSQTALGRVGLADDVGGAVAAILSDESNWINAQRIEVSGGILI